MEISILQQNEKRIVAYIEFRSRNKKKRDKQIRWFRVECLECPDCDEPVIGRNVWELTKIDSYKNAFAVHPHYNMKGK